MEFTLKKLPLFTLITLILGACSSGQSGDSVNSTSPGVLEDEVLEVITTYNGSYQTFCGVSLFAPLSSTSVTVTTIDGDSGSITIYNYLDKGCTIPAIPNQTILNLSLSYPGDTIETNRGIADFIDITVESITLDGEAPDVLQQQQLTSANVLSTRYDIIALQDSALYTGENINSITGISAQFRPTTLSSNPSIAQ